MRPHLINGFKYDLRLYVLITSFEPLTIFLYRDGLVRFATQPYTTKCRKKRFVHLTNFSVNKKASNYKKATGKAYAAQGEEETEFDNQNENASKWSLKFLKKYYESNNIDFESVFDSINDLVIKTAISVEPLLAN